jgi:hypothetical protein
MLNICCDNCACSQCKHWKTCNDHVYEADYWCYNCNDYDLDHCFEPTGSCEVFVLEKPAFTHPLYNESTREKANKYYIWE